MNSNRILIIDQDAAFIQTVSGYFSSIGIEVVSSGDGIEGYRMAKEVTPGIVILDTELPNLDGFQVCRLLKGDDRYQHIPIVSNRTTTTNVMVKNGETLLIGGLIFDQDDLTVGKLPFFGDLPFFGKFFRTNSKKKSQNELLIFITTTIISS